MLPFSEEWEKYGLTTPMGCLSEPMRLVKRHITQMWATTTWSGYANLMARYVDFCRLHRLELEADENACLFVVQTEVSLGSQHQYAKTLMAILRRLGYSTPTLSMMAAGMRNEGALLPLHQAVPLTMEALQILEEDGRVPADIMFAILLAWSTASRWDDIFQLQRGQFLQVSPSRITIDWADRTKTSKGDPFRQSMCVVVEGRFTADLARLVDNMGPDPSARVTETTTSQFDKLMKRLGYPWTGHSMKRGAGNLLIERAAAGDLSVHTISTLLKHKTCVDFAPTTIRYLSDRQNLALALRTQDATRFL